MKDQKTSRLNVRLTAEEHAHIGQCASAAGLTVSEYVRRAALNDGNRPIIRADAESLQALLRNLKRTGGSLNQCARELNTHHKPDRVENELAIAFSAVAAASDEVAAFIRDARNSI